MIVIHGYEVVRFTLVLLRVGFILMMVPVFGSRMVPRRVRIGIGILMSFLIYPYVAFKMPDTLGLWEMVPGFFAEIVIGMTMGMITQIMFAGIQVAGQIAGYQMGFGIVNVIDPMTSQQVSIAAQFYYLFAVLLFLATGTHRIFIQALVESFRYIPPMQAHLSGFNISRLMKLAGNIFVLAVKVGAPVLAITLFTQVVLGIVARTVPQINVFIVGFPLQIGIGLVGIGLSLPLLASLLTSLFKGLGWDIFSILRTLGHL